MIETETTKTMVHSHNLVTITITTGSRLVLAVIAQFTMGLRIEMVFFLRMISLVTAGRVLVT